MEEQELQVKVIELEQRVSELERIYKRQRLIRIIMIVAALFYVLVAVFAYGRLLNSISI